MLTLLLFAGLFDRVTQAHPGRDSCFCRDRARRSAHALPTRPVTPDGQPPLSIQSTSSARRVSQSIGLICLGSVLACLCLRPGATFPHGAITALALARWSSRLCLALGSRDGSHTLVLWTAAITVLLFLCISIDALFIYALLTYGSACSLFSGLPSSTTRVSWASFPR